jgi:hypothetical protein
MKSEPDDPNLPHVDRKSSERSLILLLVGCLLLTPPLAGIFQLDIRILGIPFTGLYLFAVWGMLIAGAAILSGRLQKSTEWENPDIDSDRDPVNESE